MEVLVRIGTAAAFVMGCHRVLFGGGDAHLGPCRVMWGLFASNYLVEWTPT